MKDISITDYLGPGTYLLCNYPQNLGTLISEKGYKVYHCDDTYSISEFILSHRIDYIMVHDIDNNLNKYIDLLGLSSLHKVKKIIINTVVDVECKITYFDFLDIASKYKYYRPAEFYAINTQYDQLCEKNQNVSIFLSYGDNLTTDLDDKKEDKLIPVKFITDILTYIRPGDHVLVISESKSNIDDIIYQQTKISSIEQCSLDDLNQCDRRNDGYHFILVNYYDYRQSQNALACLINYLLPTGRCVFAKPNEKLIHILADLNVHPEVYFEHIRGKLIPHIHQGEVIISFPELCVFMKSPLARTDFAYEETIYGYSSPPDNLLAFDRDYTNPWLIRGVVEFPFRNRSAWHLKQYSLQILSQYAPLSPDYAAGLAVLGYQLLSGDDKLTDIISKISAYCFNLTRLNSPSPHQIRWFISLSTLLGLIYNKKNNKIKALIYFSHATNVSVSLFSPSIGTKILQSLYFESIILLSIGKKTSAEIIIDRAIKRGISLFYQEPEELIGKFSNPFNFVMFIYHDIIDWLIKLINLKKEIISKKIHLSNFDNRNTWSTLLHDRMDAINDMSSMIDERDKTIHSQTQLIDERDNTILHQKEMIDERDNTNQSQKRLIDERDNTILHQKEMIDERDDIILAQKQLIDERDDIILAQKQLIDERDNTIIQQKRMINDRDSDIQMRKKLIDDRDNTVLHQKNIIDEKCDYIHNQEDLVNKMNSTIQYQRKSINILKPKVAEYNEIISTLRTKDSDFSILLDEKERQLTLLTAKLEKAESILRKISNIPFIGFFIRRYKYKIFKK